MANGFFGGGFGSLLNSLSEAGFFSYVLPFLIIFSLVYGILLKVKIFEENKKINGIIAFAVGLMALQFEMVPIFFAELFPRLGVALGIILVILILLGLFLPENQAWVSYSLLGIVGVITASVLIKSSRAIGGTWDFGYFFSQYGPMLIAVVFIVVVVAIIMNSDKKEKVPNPITLLTKALSSGK